MSHIIIVYLVLKLKTFILLESFVIENKILIKMENKASAYIFNI